MGTELKEEVRILQKESLDALKEEFPDVDPCMALGIGFSPDNQDCISCGGSYPEYRKGCEKLAAKLKEMDVKNKKEDGEKKMEKKKEVVKKVKKVKVVKKEKEVVKKVKEDKDEKNKVKRVKTKRLGIGVYVLSRLKQSKKITNEALLNEVKKKFPDANTNIGNIGWYRNKFKHS